MKKLVCDRCGLEFADKDGIDLVFEGKEAWEAACRAYGVKPRGILPCKNYVRCGGEIRLMTDNVFVRCYRWLVKLLKQQRNSLNDKKGLK